MGPSTDRLYRTNLAEVESGKKERLEELRRKTIDKYKEMEEAGKGMFRLHETRNTLDALREEVGRSMLLGCEDLKDELKIPLSSGYVTGWGEKDAKGGGYKLLLDNSSGQ